MKNCISSNMEMNKKEKCGNFTFLDACKKSFKFFSSHIQSNDK